MLYQFLIAPDQYRLYPAILLRVVQPRFIEIMGASQPSGLARGLHPANCLSLDYSEARDASLRPISDIVIRDQISSYLVERSERKLLIAVFKDRIDVIGVRSGKLKTYLVPAITITASALCNYHEEPFLLVATSQPSSNPENPPCYFLLKFELEPLFPLDTVPISPRTLFQEPVKFPINAPVTYMDFYDKYMMLVGHILGYSRLRFDYTYSEYVCEEYCQSKERVAAVLSSPKTETKMFVVATEGHLIVLSDDKSTELQNPMKIAVSLAIYPQLALLFVFARDIKAKQYIQIWDLSGSSKALLCEKSLVSRSKLTQMLIKPCIKMAGVISILLFSESDTLYVLEYTPLPVELFPAFKLQLDRASGSLVKSYLKDGDCYLLSPSLFLLPQKAFLPHHEHAFWTIPILASPNDMELRANVESQRHQVREMGLGLRETMEKMITQRPGSAAMSRADTAFTR